MAATEENFVESRIITRLEQAKNDAFIACQHVATVPPGKHKMLVVEDDHSVTHYFAAKEPGYDGWYWAVVVTSGDSPETPEDEITVTISEVALVAGDTAVIAPEWVPWDQRVRPGDLQPGDELPPADQDPRLTTAEDGSRILSEQGKQQAVARWSTARGKQHDFARLAQFHCANCAFLLPVGDLPEVGVCGNEYALDGRVVSTDFGCGAHSATAPEPPVVSHRHEVWDDTVYE